MQPKTARVGGNLRWVFFDVHEWRDGSAESVGVGQQHFADQTARLHI